MSKYFRSIFLVHSLIIVLFSLFFLRAIFHTGFMYSHDSLWHVERLQDMYSLVGKKFPVRWSPTLDHGYGVPLFNFTYPAPYYLGAGFMSLGLGPIKTYDLLLVSFYILGGIGVYLLGRKRPWIGLVAALLYLATPYQFLDIFVRGALGEVVALGLIPWVFLSFEQISSSGKLRWFSSLPFAFLLLSHNFYAYLIGALLLFLIITLYRHKRQLIYSFLFSLALSAFFLLPAFFEKSYLLFSQSDHLGYRDHFVSLSQLIYSKWSYLGSLPGNNPQEMSFRLGLANLVIFLASFFLVVFLGFKRKLPQRLGILFIITIICIFLMTSPSDFLWRFIPLLSSIQFPWRFLGLLTILFPLLYLELAEHSFRSHKAKLFILISVCLLSLAIYNSRNYSRPVKWLTPEEFMTFHYEYAGQTTTAKRSEIVPRWAPVERYNSSLAPEINGGELTNYINDPLNVSFSVNTSESGETTIERNYFPSWVGEIDGQKTVLTPTSTGEISLPIISGQHSYRVYLASTIIEKLGNLISLLSFIILCYVFLQKNIFKS